MKIIKAHAEFISDVDGVAICKDLESYGRVCYKSENAIKENSYISFLKKIIESGHESILEHKSLTARFIVDRGISHEIVRHRLASYSQESTRYCNYSSGKFGNEITVIKPCFFKEDDPKYDIWKNGCKRAEDFYFSLLEHGAKPQEARSVLPNSLKTEVIMTANIREWRHFFVLRTSEAAHPQMREVATQLLMQAKHAIPVLFDDIGKIEW